MMIDQSCILGPKEVLPDICSFHFISVSNRIVANDRIYILRVGLSLLAISSLSCSCHSVSQVLVMVIVMVETKRILCDGEPSGITVVSQETPFPVRSIPKTLQAAAEESFAELSKKGLEERDLIQAQ